MVPGNRHPRLRDLSTHGHFHTHGINKCQKLHAVMTTALKSTAPMGWPCFSVAACLSFSWNLYACHAFQEQVNNRRGEYMGGFEEEKWKRKMT